MPAERIPAEHVEIVAALARLADDGAPEEPPPPTPPRSTAMSPGYAALDSLVAPARMNAVGDLAFLDEDDGDGSAHGVPR
jgi:hypothetical protein